MPTVNIEDKLYGNIKEYCRLNGLTVTSFVNDLLRERFSVEKYGDMPPFFKKREVESAVVTGTLTRDGKFEQEKVEVKEVVEEEPVAKKEEPSPAVVNKEDELNEKERARKRVRYL